MSIEKERFERWLHHPDLDPQLKLQLEGIANQPDEISERFYTHLTFGTGGLRGELGAGTNRMNIYTIRKATLGLARYIHQHAHSGSVDIPTSTSQSFRLNQSASPSQEKKSVVIAYDCRHQSAVFAEEAALTLAKEGIKAYLFSSLRATPQLSFAVRRLRANGGIVITASHNPPEYNGYKVYGSDGAQLNLEEADQVITHVNRIEDELAVPVLDKKEATQHNLLQMVDPQIDREYVDYVASLSLEPDVIKRMANQFQIVFTPLHGTALEPVTQVLKQAGFEQVHIIPEQAHPDPDFSTVKSPNPEEHEAFALAIQYAQKNGADIIMGTDPDADRMGIVIQNPAGEYQVLTGNQTGALLLHYILTQMKETGELTPEHIICKTIVTSELGREIGRDFGLQTIDTLTGFKFIGEKIKECYEQGERRFIFGYEESYGYLIGDEVRDKDAIQAVLLAAEMGAYYKSKGMSIYDALQELYQQYGYYREELLSITLKGKEGIAKINSILTDVRENPPQRVANQEVIAIEDYERNTRLNCAAGTSETLHLPTSNVLKYFLEDGTWFCVRPSGTEPKLKIYIGVTADTDQEAQAKLIHARKDIEKIIAAHD